MKILTRKYLLGRVAHGSGGHYCFISPIQHIMHYFTQNMPTTPLQQETSHIRMPLDARSMGSARQTGHTPPQPHLQKLHTEGQRTILFYLAHPAYHALLHTKHTAKPYNKRHPLLEVPSGQDPWVLPAKPDIPPMAAPPLPPHLNG